MAAEKGTVKKAVANVGADALGGPRSAAPNKAESSRRKRTSVTDSPEVNAYFRLLSAGTSRVPSPTVLILRDTNMADFFHSPFAARTFTP